MVFVSGFAAERVTSNTRRDWRLQSNSYGAISGIALIRSEAPRRAVYV